MKKPNLQGFLFLVFIIFVLIGTGCGGGTNQGKDAANIGGSVGGYGIDGLIINGDVYIYSYNGARGDLLAQSKTDASGRFTTQIGNYSGPILIEVKNGYYIEEASSKRVDLNVGDYLSAVTFYSAGSSLSNLMVTPMTTLAASLAGYYQGAGDNVSNAINKANTALSNLVLVDILDTYPADLTDEKNKPGGVTNSAKYGAVLAGLSQMSAEISIQNNTQPHTVYNTIALTKAIAIDISDGKLNGKKVSDDVYIGTTKLNSYALRKSLGVSAINFMSGAYNKSGLVRGDVEGYLSQIAANSGSLFPSEDKPMPIDTEPPVITITEPAQGAFAAGKLKIRVVAADFSEVKSLTITSPSFPNTNFFDYDSTANVYLMEVDTTQAPDGKLIFNITATDAASNTSVAELDVIVDNTKPQINITSPISGAFVNLDVVTVTGTITDAGSGAASINFVRGGQSAAAKINGNSFTADLNMAADGQYDYTVNVTDMVGNQSSSAYTLKKDTVAPGLTLKPSYYYDEQRVVATVNSTNNGLVVGYSLPSIPVQQDSVTEVNFAINKYITRLSSGNSYKESVLDWKQGNYDYNIPYYKFAVSDTSLAIGSSPIDVVVTYQYSQQVNNQWVVKRDWAAAPYVKIVVDNVEVDRDYIIPISLDYLGPALAMVANDVNNMVTVRMVDQAGNSGYRNFYFKINLLGPPVYTVYDPTLSVSPYFTKSDSLYMYSYDSRQYALGRTLKAIGVLISNPNDATVYIDPRNVTGSVTVTKKVIAARGADTSTPGTSGCGTPVCTESGMINYGGEYASKDYSYTINSVYGFIGGFRDVASQQLIATDVSGYYPLKPGQTVVGYSSFDNLGYSIYSSGQLWNWRYGGTFAPNTVTNASLVSGAYQWCITDTSAGITYCAFTSAPQFTLVDDYKLLFNLNWSGSVYSGPYIQGVNTNNLHWYAPYSSGGATLVNWTRTQLGTCQRYTGTGASCAFNCVDSVLNLESTQICEDFAVNNVNATDRVRGALP